MHVKSLDHDVSCLLKIVNILRIITKFATIVPYMCIIVCTNFDKQRTTFAEVTLKNRMDPSSRTQERLTTVLYLRSLKHILKC